MTQDPPPTTTEFVPGSRLFPKLLPVALLCLVSAICQAAPSNINRSAQSLAKHLKPNPPAKSSDEKHLATIGKQMSGALEELEKSYRSSGPNPESLLSKALEFRDDIGTVEAVVLQHTLLTAWREANAMGLFDDSGKFQPVVSKGRGTGDRCLFEWIVPGEAYPPASNQMVNIRLVREDEKRTAAAELSQREIAFHQQLKQVIAEKEESVRIAKHQDRGPLNSLGQDEKSHEEDWQREVAETGDAYHELPNINLKSKVTSTPSHSTKGRWIISAELRNNSSHPTEVTIDIWMIGRTFEKGDYYLMAKSTHPLKLRRNEVRSIETFTKPESSYKQRADDHDELSKEERKNSRVRFRGYVMRVTHEKGLVTFQGNDRMMTGYGDPKDEDGRLDKLPSF